MKIVMTGASGIGHNGLATQMFRLGQAMDTTDIQIDYLAQKGISDSVYQQAIERKGGKVLSMKKSCANPVLRKIASLAWACGVFKKESYDAIHINVDMTYHAALYILVAKLAGIRKVVVHSHNSSVSGSDATIKIKTLLHKLCRPYVLHNTDLRLACSKTAGKWMFNDKEAIVIPNGVDLDKFRFDSDIRRDYRSMLGIQDDCVICSVGRLCYQKNIFFTVDIFEKIIEQKSNSKLLLVGSGELRNDLEQYIEKKHLSDSILILGNRDDVPNLLSASDVFLLPSRFEGLGIVFIEAQANGMPVCASDVVPEEAFATDLIFKESLLASPGQWAAKIIRCSSLQRQDCISVLEHKGYSVLGAARMLEGEYTKLLN